MNKKEYKVLQEVMRPPFPEDGERGFFISPLYLLAEWAC